MTAASIALTKLPFFFFFCYNSSPNRYSVNVSARCFFTCLPNESSTPATHLIRYSNLSVQQALHQNLAFMLDLAAPHAIRKTDIIDQSSNSRLFQQAGKKKKKKKNRFKLYSPVLRSRWKRQLCIHFLFILTAIRSNWWGSSLVTARLQYKSGVGDSITIANLYMTPGN